MTFIEISTEKKKLEKFQSFHFENFEIYRSIVNYESTCPVSENEKKTWLWRWGKGGEKFNVLWFKNRPILNRIHRTNVETPRAAEAVRRKYSLFHTAINCRQRTRFFTGVTVRTRLVINLDPV